MGIGNVYQGLLGKYSGIGGGLSGRVSLPSSPMDSISKPKDYTSVRESPLGMGGTLGMSPEMQFKYDELEAKKKAEEDRLRAEENARRYAAGVDVGSAGGIKPVEASAPLETTTPPTPEIKTFSDEDVVQKTKRGGTIKRMVHGEGDVQPVLMEAGEYVLPRKAAGALKSKIGEHGMEMLRKGHVPRMREGGWRPDYRGMIRAAGQGLVEDGALGLAGGLGTLRKAVDINAPYEPKVVPRTPLEEKWAANEAKVQADKAYEAKLREYANKTTAGSRPDIKLTGGRASIPIGEPIAGSYESPIAGKGFEPLPTAAEPTPSRFARLKPSGIGATGGRLGTLALLGLTAAQQGAKALGFDPEEYLGGFKRSAPEKVEAARRAGALRAEKALPPLATESAPIEYRAKDFGGYVPEEYSSDRLRREMARPDLAAKPYTFSMPGNERYTMSRGDKGELSFTGGALPSTQTELQKQRAELDAYLGRGGQLNEAETAEATKRFYAAKELEDYRNYAQRMAEQGYDVTKEGGLKRSPKYVISDVDTGRVDALGNPIILKKPVDVYTGKMAGEDTTPSSKVIVHDDGTVEIGGKRMTRQEYLDSMKTNAR